LLITAYTLIINIIVINFQLARVMILHLHQLLMVTKMDLPQDFRGWYNNIVKSSIPPSSTTTPTLTIITFELVLRVTGITPELPTVVVT